ncbi:MAG: hypothetical protein ACKOFI_01175, partial [Phycisphaerales bacterium]
VDEALDLLSLSAALVPDAGTVALLAYGQLLSGDDVGARRTVGALLAEAPWRDEELTVLVEWLLGAVGGDRLSAESLSMAAYSAGPGGFGELPAPAERRARIARLLIAAGDVEGGRQAIDDAVDAGALDPTSLATAFAAASDRAAVRALAIVQARPDALRDVCRSLVATARDLRALRTQVEALGDSPFRAPLSAGVMAACNGSGDAWRRAEDALDAATQPAVQRAALEAMLLAAVAAGDPSLVARAAADAPGALEMSGAWHASLARAFADTGAAIESAASARPRGDPSGARPSTVARASASDVRATSPASPAGRPRSSARAIDCCASMAAPVSAKARASEACQAPDISRAPGASAAARATSDGSPAATAASSMASSAARCTAGCVAASSASSARRQASPEPLQAAITPAESGARNGESPSASSCVRNVRRSRAVATSERHTSRNASGRACTMASARTAARSPAAAKAVAMRATSSRWPASSSSSAT